MKKQLLSILTILALCLSLLPTAALAADPHTHCICGGTTNIGDHTTHTASQEWTAWTSTTELPTTAGQYYLTADVTLSAEWVPTGAVSLCLNGYDILYTNGAGTTVGSDTTLSITDCSTSVTTGYIGSDSLWHALPSGDAVPSGATACDLTGGVITGGTGSNAFGDGGAFSLHGTKDSVFNLYGGNIAGNSTQNNGGAVMIGDNTDSVVTSVFQMYGGSITGNKVTGRMTGGGGGVYVSETGTFNMHGGSISGNEGQFAGGGVGVGDQGTFAISGGSITNNSANGMLANSAGGGVLVQGTFTMTGGTISGNSAKGRGGGVFVEATYDGAFVMSGGTVQGNTAKNGGGVYLSDHTTQPKTGRSSLTMNGGSIIGNSATVAGGGVWVSQGNITLSGSPTISGNTLNSAAQNIALPSGKTIAIGDSMVTGASVGVTTATAPTESSPVTVASKSGVDISGYKDYFFSDKGYKVVMDSTNNNIQFALTSLSDATVTVAEGGVYDGDAKKPAVTVTLNGKTLTETTDYTVSYNNNTNATTEATVTVTAAANSIYGGSKTEKFTIAKADGEGSVTMEDWGEWETAADPIPVSETNGTDSVTYKYKAKDADDSTYVADNPKSAGSYTVKATFPATENYNEVTATCDFTIKTKVDVAVTGAPDAALTYGDADIILTAAVEQETDSDTWIWSSSDPTVLQVTGSGNTATVKILKTGSATVSVRYESDTTAGEAATETITVGQRALTVQPKAVTVYVNAAEPTLELEYDGLVSGDSVTPSETPTFKLYKSDGTTEISAADAVKTAGTYIIKWENETSTTFTGGENYTISKFAEAELKVNTRPSSGGGGYVAPTYSVTMEDIENGNVKLTPSRASSGDTVTITVTPDEGYELESLTVTNASGKEIEVTDKGDGTYTFKMPVGKVTVVPVFGPEGMSAADCPKDNTCPVAAFTDVDPGAWYHDGIHYALENGMMAGYGNGLFGTNDSITRGQIVTILWRLEGSPVVNYLMNFEDVPAEKYYTEAIRWANSEGIVGGYGNGKFGPDDPITRQQLAAMLWRYAQHTGQDVSVGEDTNILSYEDAFDISEYAIPAMQWACGAGIMGGYGNGYLGPNDGATRAQAAAMLQRYCELSRK